MGLPQFQGGEQPFQLMQNAWASKLDPMLGNPSLQSIILKGVSLASGSTVVNHKLGRTPQGWRVVDADAGVTIYRSAPLNNLTLTLTSSAAVNVSLEVF